MKKRFEKPVVSTTEFEAVAYLDMMSGGAGNVPGAHTHSWGSSYNAGSWFNPSIQRSCSCGKTQTWWLFGGWKDN